MFGASGQLFRVRGVKAAWDFVAVLINISVALISIACNYSLQPVACDEICAP